MKAIQLLLFLALTFVLPQAGIAMKTAAATEVTPATENVATLDKKERKELRKDLRKELKAQRKALRKNASEDAPSTSTLLLIILAILLPPLAVGIYEGGLTNRFWLSVLLWLLFYIPGLIYALIVILG